MNPSSETLHSPVLLKMMKFWKWKASISALFLKFSDETILKLNKKEMVQLELDHLQKALLIELSL